MIKTDKLLRWTLCLIGIHWRGKVGLGMWGDAARCEICGHDAYGLFIVRPTNKE